MWETLGAKLRLPRHGWLIPRGSRRRHPNTIRAKVKNGGEPSVKSKQQARSRILEEGDMDDPEITGDINARAEAMTDRRTDGAGGVGDMESWTGPWAIG